MMKGNQLDVWLSRGYYRMQQDIFTCQFVAFDDRAYVALWLRIVLANVSYGKKQLELIRKNEKYLVTTNPFVLSDEVEALYYQYRQSVNFDAPDSVESCLLDGASHTVFDTHIIEVRDGNRLIAAGIFDNGSQSMAGIMNFYHPAYRKQSLGKYLMLQKIKYAQVHNKMYYYPGYLVHNYPKFDYKLFADETATEVLDSTSGIWLPFSWKAVTALSATIMEQARLDYPYDGSL